MSFLIFIFSFTLLTIVSSFFIISFYELTRNYIIIQPDGKEKTEGYILKFWSKWIEKIKMIERVYYSGEPLQHKLSELKKMLPAIAKNFDTSKELTCLMWLPKYPILEEERDKVERVIQCSIYEKEDLWFLYLEEPVYYIPDIIRKPLSSCVVCMSSVFGSVIWLSINHCYKAFEWANHKYFAFYLFWVIFITVISKLNKYLYSKLYS